MILTKEIVKSVTELMAANNIVGDEAKTVIINQLDGAADDEAVDQVIIPVEDSFIEAVKLTVEGENLSIYALANGGQPVAQAEVEKLDPEVIEYALSTILADEFYKEEEAPVEEPKDEEAPAEEEPKEEAVEEETATEDEEAPAEEPSEEEAPEHNCVEDDFYQVIMIDKDSDLDEAADFAEEFLKDIDDKYQVGPIERMDSDEAEDYYEPLTIELVENKARYALEIQICTKGIRNIEEFNADIKQVVWRIIHAYGA